jgi:hypothetical protein
LRVIKSRERILLAGVTPGRCRLVLRARDRSAGQRRYFLNSSVLKFGHPRGRFDRRHGVFPKSTGNAIPLYRQPRPREAEFDAYPVP